MPNTFSKIQTITVGAGGASTIDLTAIPNYYTDLCLKMSARSTTTTGTITITINGSSSTFTSRYLQGNGATASSSTYTTQVGLMSISSDTASAFGNFELYLPNYLSANNKSFYIDCVTENNGATAYGIFNAGLWSTGSAVTSISLAGAFAQYSTAILYGIKDS